MATLPGFSLARRLAAGETVYTGWCALPAPIIVETLAREGFVAVTIDQQHGLWDTAATVNGIAAIRAGGNTPLARVGADSGPACVFRTTLLFMHLSNGRTASWLRFQPCPAALAWRNS